MAGNLRNNCLLIFVYLTVVVLVSADPNADMNTDQAMDPSFLNEARFPVSSQSIYRNRYDDTVPYYMKRRTDYRSRLLNLLQKYGQSPQTVHKRPFDSISYQGPLGGMFLR